MLPMGRSTILLLFGALCSAQAPTAEQALSFKSPDSKRLAFSTLRDGKGQIWLISPTGGEAVALTNEEASPGGFRWSPDGKRIAFTSAGPEPKELKDRKERYGDFEIYQKDYRQSQRYAEFTFNGPAFARSASGTSSRFLRTPSQPQCRQRSSGDLTW
jgi:Tol biopolymer transport system component